MVNLWLHCTRPGCTTAACCGMCTALVGATIRVGLLIRCGDAIPVKQDPPVCCCKDVTIMGPGDMARSVGPGMTRRTSVGATVPPMPGLGVIGLATERDVTGLVVLDRCPWGQWCLGEDM